MALQCFECGNAVELHNRIMFNFYPGLPHMVIIEAFLGEGKKSRNSGTHLVKETQKGDLLVATLVIS